MALPYRDINVQVGSDLYLFSSPSSPAAPALIIDRPTGDIRLADGAIRDLAGKRPTRISNIAGILGMIQLRLDKYIVTVLKAQPVGRLKGHLVYKAVSTEILPLRERLINDPDEEGFLTLIKTFLRSEPMYFSYTLDISNSFQRQARQDMSVPMWLRADDRFFWNHFLQSDLIRFRIEGSRGYVGVPGPQPGIDPFILPVISGMVEIHPTRFMGSHAMIIALISRRSRHRAGTRYFSRGLDDEGHASNYNETEQIVILNDSGTGLGGYAGGSGSNMQSGKFGPAGDRPDVQILSYVQTRGSVPVSWAEVNNLKFTPKIQIHGIQAALPAAKAHFDEQIRIYGDNYLVNLINQRGRELQVKQAYEHMVDMLLSAPHPHTQSNERTDEKFTIESAQASSSSSSQQRYDRLHYIYFDFHAETKGSQMHRAQLLIDKLHDALLAQQYFRAVDMPARRDGRLDVRAQQTSVVRTNCMDCLDRTNVVQSLFARFTLNRMLADLGLLPSGAVFSDADPAFELLFRNMWADNADVVATSYSGTGAMKTDLTRLGVRTKTGALNDVKISLTRYCRNNFFDGPRQDAFDLVLGAYQPTTAHPGTHCVFADRRHVLIQSIPYVLAFSIFFVLVAWYSNPLSRQTVWPLRLFMFFWAAVAAWCARFILTYGMLFVNWPKLNPRPWAVEGYHDIITNVRKDKILGPWVAGHERGLSAAKYANAEEGKKRIE